MAALDELTVPLLDGTEREVAGFARGPYAFGSREELEADAEATLILTAKDVESGADADDIRARDAHARDRGVTGVPTFTAASRYRLGIAKLREMMEGEP